MKKIMIPVPCERCKDLLEMGKRTREIFDDKGGWYNQFRQE